MDKNAFLTKYIEHIPSLLKTQFKLDYDSVQRHYYVGVFNAIKEECDSVSEFDPGDWIFVEQRSPANLIGKIHRILITT